MAKSPQVLRELPEPEFGVLPGVKLQLILPSPTIASGDEARARLRIHNRSDDDFRFMTAPLLLAFIVLTKTRSAVGSVSGHMAAVGTSIHLAPGGGSSLDVMISARGGCRNDANESGNEDLSELIPGTYGVIVEMPLRLQSASQESHVRWSPEIPIEVTSRAKAWY
jgi:hypothetical protein